MGDQPVHQRLRGGGVHAVEALDADRVEIERLPAAGRMRPHERVAGAGRFALLLRRHRRHAARRIAAVIDVVADKRVHLAACRFVQRLIGGALVGEARVAAFAGQADGAQHRAPGRVGQVGVVRVPGAADIERLVVAERIAMPAREQPDEGEALDAVFRALHRLRHVLAEQAGEAHEARLVDLHVAEYQHHPVGPGVLQAPPGRPVRAVAADVEPDHLRAGQPRQRAYLERHNSRSPFPVRRPGRSACAAPARRCGLLPCPRSIPAS